MAHERSANSEQILKPHRPGRLSRKLGALAAVPLAAVTACSTTKHIKAASPSNFVYSGITQTYDKHGKEIDTADLFGCLPTGSGGTTGGKQIGARLFVGGTSTGHTAMTILGNRFTALEKSLGNNEVVLTDATYDDTQTGTADPSNDIEVASLLKFIDRNTGAQNVLVAEPTIYAGAHCVRKSAVIKNVRAFKPTDTGGTYTKPVPVDSLIADEQLGTYERGYRLMNYQPDSELATVLEG